MLASVVRAAGSAAGGARDIGDRRPRVCDDREQLRRRPQLDAGVEVPAADSGVSQYDLPVSSCGWVTQFWQLTVFMLGKTVAGLAAVLPVRPPLTTAYIHVPTSELGGARAAVCARLHQMEGGQWRDWAGEGAKAHP